jgi:hypothetical protein
MNFQKIILIIAIILLIVSLIIIGVAMSNPSGSSGGSWPIAVSPCPDYWITKNGSTTCANVHNLGNDTPQCKTMDFGGSQFTGPNGGCAKKTWASGCNVTWDGITYGYGNSNPCAAPSSTPS